MQQKTFSIGNSIAVTIPAKTKIKANTPIKFISKSGNKLIYKILDSKESNIEDLSKGIKWKIDKNQLEKQLKYLEDNQYE